MSVWVGERDLALLLPHLQRKHWQLSTGGSSLPLLLRLSPQIYWPPSSSHTFSISPSLSLTLPLFPLVPHILAQFLPPLTSFPYAIFTFHYVHPSFLLHCLLSFCLPHWTFLFVSFFCCFFTHDCISVYSLGISHQATQMGRCWTVCC